MIEAIRQAGLLGSDAGQSSRISLAAIARAQGITQESLLLANPELRGAETVDLDRPIVLPAGTGALGGKPLRAAETVVAQTEQPQPETASAGDFPAAQVEREWAALSPEERRGIKARNLSAAERATAVHEFLYEAERLPGQITPTQLHRMGATQANAELYARPLSDAMSRYGLVSAEQRAAFLGQVYTETGSLGRLTENLNYSANRLKEVWPRRFPTVEAARPYANNAEALAERVTAAGSATLNQATASVIAAVGFFR